MSHRLTAGREWDVSLQVMDFSEVLASYEAWGRQLGLTHGLRDAGRNPGLDVELLRRADLSEFGRWLSGSGRDQFGHLPEFADLITAHNALHEGAAAIAFVCNGGADAQAAFERPDGAYAALLRPFRLALWSLGSQIPVQREALWQPQPPPLTAARTAAETVLRLLKPPRVPSPPPADLTAVGQANLARVELAFAPSRDEDA